MAVTLSCPRCVYWKIVTKDDSDDSPVTDDSPISWAHRRAKDPDSPCPLCGHPSQGVTP